MQACWGYSELAEEKVSRHTVRLGTWGRTLGQFELTPEYSFLDTKVQLEIADTWIWSQ